jgi:hypothetical protein
MYKHEEISSTRDVRRNNKSKQKAHRYDLGPSTGGLRNISRHHIVARKVITIAFLLQHERGDGAAWASERYQLRAHGARAQQMRRDPVCARGRVYDFALVQL